MLGDDERQEQPQEDNKTAEEKQKIGEGAGEGTTEGPGE